MEIITYEISQMRKVRKYTESVRLGGLYDEETKIHQMGSVWDKNYLCPTIDTAQGGYRQPMIVEDVIIGGLQEHQSVKTDGVCTCLTTAMGAGGGNTPLVINEVKRMGNLSDTKTQSRTVYDADGISPKLCSGMDHGNTMPHICEKKHIETATEVINPLKGLSDNGWHFEQNVYDPNGLVRTVKAGGGSGNIPKVIENMPLCLNSKGGRNGVEGLQPSLQDRVYDSNAISTAVTTSFMPSFAVGYRIRKLTPKECWRLMAFKDEDFHKAEQVNSNTQLYKQAGNSIVVSVLEAVFRQMRIQNLPTWNEEKGVWND